MGKRTGQNRQFWESATLNNATYQHYYNRLMELSCVMFEWKNLPDTVDARFLELCLFGKGMAVFFNDPALGFLSLPVATGGQWNVYNIPIYRRAFATNGYNRDLTDEDSVIIYNNYLRRPTMPDIELFARRLYQCDRIADINIQAQKTPVLLVGSEQQQLTLKNLYMKYEGNEPVIYGDKFLDANGLKVLKTDAPFVADKIRTEKDCIWNEALTYLGISNINIVKKERMISDEVSRNQGGTIASRYSRLEMRRMACDEINKKFGLNIDCEYREDYRELVDNIMLSGESGDGKPDAVATDIKQG